jgi:hypothetical protein
MTVPDGQPAFPHQAGPANNALKLIEGCKRSAEHPQRHWHSRTFNDKAMLSALCLASCSWECWRSSFSSLPSASEARRIVISSSVCKAANIVAALAWIKTLANEDIALTYVYTFICRAAPHPVIWAHVLSVKRLRTPHPVTWDHVLSVKRLRTPHPVTWAHVLSVKRLRRSLIFCLRVSSSCPIRIPWSPFPSA